MIFRRLTKTLRGKLVLAALLVETVMLTLLVGNSLRLLNDTLTEEARRNAQQLVPILQSALVAPLLQHDQATVRAILDECENLDGLLYLAVADAKGKVISASGWPLGKPLPPPDSAISLVRKDGTARHDLAAPLTFSGQSLGTLHLGLDLSPIVLARRAMLTQGVVIAICGVLLSALLLTLVGLWLTRQLRRLETAAEALERGRFVPLPAPADDDIGRLVGAFNTMGASVEARISAEKRLRLMASVFENAQEGVMVTDANARIVEINNSFSTITGYTREDVVGEKPSLLRSGRHAPAFYTEMWQALESRGHWMGEIYNRRKDGEVYPELLTISAVSDDSGQLLHYISIFSDISTFKAQQERLERMAHFDPLTGLPNRTLLADRLDMALAQARRQQHRIGVALLDLDGFKPINDQYGHAAGDMILVEVGRRLQAALRETDTVARLGGDEFVLVLGSLAGLDEVKITLERVLSSLARPYAIDGELAALSASVGLALYPDDEVDADTLLRHADQAMYSAKQSGRGRWHLFDADLDRDRETRLATLAQIEAALPRGELMLHYQPKVDLVAGRVIGAEALIRWQHPARGLLLPGEFLSLTEGSEFEIRLSEWVIRTALEQVAEWTKQGLDLSVSVNLPARHLQSEHFPGFMADLLANYTEDIGRRLELEVLETAALGDLHSVSQKMELCTTLGVSFALDDFGTGYASLAYLRQLPADLIKIDQSFVGGMLENPNDLAIVEAVIGLGEAFSHPVIAEGVETLEHAVLLLHLGCRQAQGFGIARPMAPAAFPGWVGNWQPDAAMCAAARQVLARPDLPLAQAPSLHRRWFATIREQLGSEPPRFETLKVGPESCALGRWLDGHGGRSHGHLPVFQRLHDLHRDLHDGANAALKLARAGQVASARASLAELEKTENRLQQAIAALITRISDRASRFPENARERVGGR